MTAILNFLASCADFATPNAGKICGYGKSSTKMATLTGVRLNQAGVDVLPWHAIGLALPIMTLFFNLLVCMFMTQTLWLQRFEAADFAPGLATLGPLFQQLNHLPAGTANMSITL
jgi:hypothetical protein